MNWQRIAVWWHAVRGLSVPVMSDRWRQWQDSHGWEANSERGIK